MFIWKNIMSQTHITPASRKKITIKKFRSSDSFSPAEYEYESFFFIKSRFSEILWQWSENKQNSLFIGCVYAEVNRQVQCFAYVKCFSRNTFHIYVQFQALDMFLKIKASKEIQYHVNGCIKHWPPFFKLFSNNRKVS